METLMERMSKYTVKLQEAVEERSAEVVKEKRKCDQLLSKMLPRWIFYWHNCLWTYRHDTYMHAHSKGEVYLVLCIVLC